MLLSLKSLLLSSKWICVAVAAGALGWSMWYVTSTILSVGELRQQNDKLEDKITQVTELNRALHSDMKALGESITRRSIVYRQIRSDILELRQLAETIEHACDPEPLDPLYIDQLRQGASVGASGVPGNTTSLGGADTH